MRPPRASSAPWRGPATAALLVALATIPSVAAWPASPEDGARFRSEWDRVRQNYERAIRENHARLAAIEAKGRADSADPERRGEKITGDATVAVQAEGKKLREANAALRKNLDLIKSSLATATDAVEAMATSLRQSGVLERATGLESAANEARERLSARWERERAEREREREQREREAGQRSRGRP